MSDTVTLAGTDRTIVGVAARLLLALPGGPPRMDAFEGLVDNYRADLAEAHPGTGPDTLDDMATNFAGALWLAMDRIVEGGKWDDDTPGSGPHMPRPRSIDGIDSLMKALDPRH